MSFDFSSLITNRTDASFYFTSDINRVSDCMDALVDALAARGVRVSGYQRAAVPAGQPNEGSLLWTDLNWPTPSFVAAQLANVRRVRDALAVAFNTPSVPAGILWSRDANNIERILLAVEESLRSLETILLRTAQPLVVCGFALYPVTQFDVTEPDEPSVGLRLYSADGRPVYTADGLAVYLER